MLASICHVIREEISQNILSVHDTVPSAASICPKHQASSYTWFTLLLRS